jgi:hypothetical protein
MKKIIIITIALISFSCSKHEDAIPEPCKTNCNLIPEAGNCKALFVRYYYDQTTKKCTPFYWGGCDGVVPFETMEECINCECK